MAKIGVCLSGCGVNDGTEIHESVITALTLDKAGAEILFTAPNMEQTKVVNHLLVMKWVRAETYWWKVPVLQGEISLI